MPNPSPRFLPAVAALVALTVIAAACTSTPPSPTASATAPVPTPTPVDGRPDPSAIAQCEPADVVLEHGPSEGAAGSRYTQVRLQLVDDAEACSVHATPEFRIDDVNANFVLIFISGGDRGPIEVLPGEVLTSDVQLSSWCDPPPAQPVAMYLVLEAGPAPIGGGPFPAADELPACAGGPGPGTEASGTSWARP